MRKLIFIFVGIVFLSSFYGRFDVTFVFQTNIAIAQTSEDEDVQEQLQDEIASQLETLDFSEIETALGVLSTEAKGLFSSNSFSQKVTYVISGEYAESGENFFSSVLSIFWGDLKNYIPIIACIISVATLGGMISSLKPAFGAKGVGEIVHFVTYGIVLVFLGTIVYQIIELTSSTLTAVKTVFDAIFPVLLTLLTGLGGSVSVGIYQPAIAMLGNGFVYLITYFLLPVLIFSIVFSIIGNLSNRMQLGQFVAFLQSLFKWAIGLCFTIFLGFVSIEGVVAGSVDGLSIRTAKYALKSYVPIVGGYVSDGLAVILASTSLIKNAVGGVGLFLLLSTVISPILNIAIFMLALKFIAGIVEPIGDKKIANFVSELSKSMSLLIALLVAVAFMYVVLTGLIMCSANLI
jgi:stage III sporulation protein AE